MRLRRWLRLRQRLWLPEALLRPIECLTQNLFISPPSLSQYAGIAAFDSSDELAGNVARYARNREILLDTRYGGGQIPAIKVVTF